MPEKENTEPVEADVEELDVTVGDCFVVVEDVDELDVLVDVIEAE